MADTPQTKKMESVLARMEEGWQELAKLLRGRSQQVNAKLVEAEKFTLVDPRGEPRGKLEWKEDGSAGLVLLDPDGKHRAWLGLKEDGSAYLTLKDRFGRILWESPQEPRRAGEAPPVTGGEPESRPPSPEVMEKLEKLADELAGLRARFEQNLKAREQGEEVQAAAPAPASGEMTTGEGLRLKLRLEQLERQQNRLKVWSGLLSGLLLVALAGLVFTVVQKPTPVQVASQPAAPPPLEVSAPAPVGEVTARTLTIQDPAGGAAQARLGARDGGLYLDLLDKDGQVRTVLGLDKAGDPSLQLYDRSHKLRAELALDPQGDPGLSLTDQADLLRVALGRPGPRYQMPAELEDRPLDSLVLINQDGVPVWRAPLRWRR
jgi:hypothetical protein